MKKKLVERTHNRNSFYKYMTAKTAEAILLSNRIRWSSPAYFNDPFDVPRELAFGLDPPDIMKALCERYIFLMNNQEEDISELSPHIR